MSESWELCFTRSHQKEIYPFHQGKGEKEEFKLQNPDVKGTNDFYYIAQENWTMTA